MAMITQWLTASQVVAQAGVKWFTVEHRTTQGVWDDDDRWVRDDEIITRVSIRAVSPLDALRQAVHDAGRFPVLIPGVWRVVED